MKNVKLTPENEEFLQHYGVLGMKWGVRKARTSAPKFSTIGELKKSSGSTGERVTSNKFFKMFVFNKDTSLLAAKGRKAFSEDFKAGADKRYQKALAKEKNKAQARQERKKATLKLIDDLIAEDKATSKFFNQSYNEVEARKFWEAMFASDLKD